MCGHCLAHIEFRNTLDHLFETVAEAKRRDAVDGIICHICGKIHIMVKTPFPNEEGWPCPYDASKEALRDRIALVVGIDPTIFDRNSDLGSVA
jgi:hypothetical protein